MPTHYKCLRSNLVAHFNNNHGNRQKVRLENDPQRETLRLDIIEGHILPSMKPLDAQKLRPECAEMDKKLFSSRLNGMHKMLAKQPSASGVKEPKWDKKNPVCCQLKQNIVDGLITVNMDHSSA